MKRLYRYPEAAGYISTSVSSILRLVDAGDIERIYINSGRDPRITVESLDSYIERQRAKTSSIAESSQK